MKSKKIIITMLLASSIITSNTYSWPWSQPEAPKPLYKKATDVVKDAAIKGGGYVVGGLGAAVGVLGRAGEVFFRKWKKIDKKYPVIASIIAGGFVYRFVKTPVNNLYKKSIDGLTYLPFPKWVKKLFEEDNDPEKAKFYVTTKPKKTMNDLAGGVFPNRKVAMLVDKRRRGMKLNPILFHGPSGTGKSLTAEVFASEIGRVTGKNVALLSTSGASFLSKYVGESPKKVRELLKDAEGMVKLQDTTIMKLYHLIRKKTHVVIFVDEMLSLVSGTKGDSQYGWATVEALQVAINQHFPNPNIDFIATSNSTDLPPAIRQRFTCIYFKPATVEIKLIILEFHLNKQSEKHLITPYGNMNEQLADALRKSLTSYTNLTPRDMSNVADQAAYCALRDENTDISSINILEALDFVIENKEEEGHSEGYTNYGDKNKQNPYEQITQQMLNKKKKKNNENLVSGVLHNPDVLPVFPTTKGHTLGENNSNDSNKKQPEWVIKQRNKFLRQRLDNQLKMHKGKFEKINEDITDLEEIIEKNAKEAEQNKTFMSKFKAFAGKFPLVSRFYKKDETKEENDKHKAKAAKLKEAKEQIAKQLRDNIIQKNSLNPARKRSNSLKFDRNFDDATKKTRKRSNSFDFKKQQRKKQSQKIDKLSL